jgi:hypothetical protein
LASLSKGQYDSPPIRRTCRRSEGAAADTKALRPSGRTREAAGANGDVHTSPRAFL